MAAAAPPLRLLLSVRASHLRLALQHPSLDATALQLVGLLFGGAHDGGGRERGEGKGERNE